VIYHFLDWWLEGRHLAYENPIFRATWSIVTSFVLVVVLAPRTIRFLISKKIGDRPDFNIASINELTRDKHNTPTMGGVLIMGSVLVSTLLWARLVADPKTASVDPHGWPPFDPFYVYMGLICLVYLTILGGIDDWLKLTSHRRGGGRQGLYGYEKLLFQIGLAVVIGAFAFRHARPELARGNPWPTALNLIFYSEPAAQLAAAPFIVFAALVLVGSSNAVNLTDGMDGLAGGCVALVSIVLTILAITVGLEKWADYLRTPKVPSAEELAVLCGAMAGACLGFLWYNCHPAAVFMGDTGSLPLGGLIGYVAIIIRNELMLFIVGGVFVIEALSVLIQVGYFKMSGGKRIFRVAPIHHHFHAAGWTETQTVVRFWILGTMFAALALAAVKMR
jgi:phospho-N-acetylmuramoyl-pentapeptide-transferase